MLQLACTGAHHDAPSLGKASGRGLACLVPRSLQPAPSTQHLPKSLILFWPPCHSPCCSAASPGSPRELYPPPSAWHPLALLGPCLLGQTVVRASWAPRAAHGRQAQCPPLSDPRPQVLGPPPPEINPDLTNIKWQSWTLYQTIYNTGV